MDDYSFGDINVGVVAGFGGLNFGDEGTIDPAQIAINIETNGDQNRGVTPQFVLIDVHDRDRSANEGRPCFKQIEAVLLRVAGDRLNIVSHPLNDDLKRRFRVQYENWKANREGADLIEGTPLKAWPVINSALVKELEALHIFNVEGLAAISDGNLHQSPSLRDLRNKAQVWLQTAKEGSQTLRLQAELDREREARADMQRQLDEMAALIKTMNTPADPPAADPPRRGPGRPPKVREDAA